MSVWQWKEKTSIQSVLLSASWVLHKRLTTIFWHLLCTVNCTKFGQLILRKIIQIVATRCHILRLKCTKFESVDYSKSAPDPAGKAHRAPPDHLAGFKGATSEGKGRGKWGRGGAGRGRREGKGGKGEETETTRWFYEMTPLAGASGLEKTVITKTASRGCTVQRHLTMEVKWAMNCTNDWISGTFFIFMSYSLCAFAQ